MPDEHGATWIPDGNYFPNRDGNKPRYIVLHGTAGGTSAVGIGDYFKSTEGGSNPVSAHYVVGLQGEVVQCVNESDGAWSNGVITGASGVSGNGVGNGFHDSWWNSGVNPNLLTVAIEHVKSATDNSTQLTDAQKQASFTLVAHICQRHAIPMRKADAHGGITGHYAIDPVNRARCPGPYPWDELFAFLGQGGGEEQVVLNIQQVANYFVEDTQEQRWYLKLPDTSNHNNNHFIGGDILKYYRTCTNIALNGFSQYGLPLAHEERVPNTKQATTQRFERGVILFDPMKEVDSVPGLPGPCYPSHIDSGPGEDPRIAQLEAELAALQKQPVAPSAPAITPIISATPIAAATSMVPTPAPAAAAPMVPAPTPAAAATPAPAPQTPSPTTQPFPQQPIPVSQMVVNAVKRDVLSPIKRLFSGS
jgi:N-acetyl-anhydromuramyl-L-alanine amidase AmpD